VWNRAYGGKYGLYQNKRYGKIAEQILANKQYSNIKNRVTKNNLNKFINSPNFRKTWNRGRGRGNVYRSKEIIKALYGLPYNMPENTTSQPFEENTPRQRQTQRPKPHVPTYGVW
jgi:hypothetical protein